MIAPRPMERLVSASLSSLTGSGKPSARNEGSLADNLSGVSSVNSPPLPVSFGGGVDSKVFYFDPNSANGQPLGDVNKAKHMEVFFTSLQEHGAKIGNLEKLTQVMNHGRDCDLKNSTLVQGTKVALALFNAVPADMQDKALIGKATDFYKAMDKLSQQPGSTAKKDAAYQALKTLTSALSEKLGLSGKNYKPENVTKLCSGYLKDNVFADINSKLEGKLSPAILEGLRKNPEGVVEYLYADLNQANNKTIDTLKAQFAQHTKKGDKVVVMYSLLAALENKTQIIAGLMPNIAAPGAPASPTAGLAADNDIGQSRPADGGNAANPGPVAPNITNITTNNYYFFDSPPPTQNNISTTNINLSDQAATTKPEDGKSQSTTANQTETEGVDFSTQTFDEIDSVPVPLPTDNLKPVTFTNTKADKSLNSAGTLYGTKGPAPSWLGQNAKVTLTNDGLVRDLSRKQADGQGGVQPKQPTSLNTFGNQFVGVGKQNPGPAPLGGASNIQQDAPQVSDTQSSSTVKDIPVSDNALNSDNKPQDADGVYRATPAKVVVERQVNALGTSFGMKAASAPTSSEMVNTDSAVTLTRGGQVRDLSRKQADGQGGVQQKQPTSVNTQGTLFAGIGKSSAAPTSPRNTDETQQVRQDTSQVSYKADLFVPGKKPSFISTLDLQVNSDGTLQQTDETYRTTPAKVAAEKQVNAQGTSFGMKAGAASASTQSEMVNNNSTVTLTQQGAQTRDLSSKLAYRLGGSQPKNSSSVNAQGNQFVGVRENTPIPGLTQSWINNKGDNVVLTQEGAQTRALTEKDQYRADNITNSRQPTTPSEVK